MRILKPEVSRRRREPRTTRSSLLGIVLLVLTITACDTFVRETIDGSGTIVDETRQVEGFDQIEISGEGRVDISLTGSESLVVTADDNLLDLIESTVSGGRLRLDVPTEVDPSADVVFNVTADLIGEILVNGSSLVTASSFDGTDLTVVINGSGDVIISGSFDRLKATVNGSGVLEPSGDADRVDANINGSGGYRGEALVTNAASVRVSGSGVAIINATETLDATVTGSGHIEYLGEPSIDRSITGSGSISQSR